MCFAKVIHEIELVTYQKHKYHVRYAYGRYKMVEAELLKGRPTRGGRVMPT